MFGLFVCARMLVLCLVVCAFAFVCVARMHFILHVQVDCTCDICLCYCLLVCARMLGFRLIVYAFAAVCCKVAFHITRVYRLRV